MRCFFVFIAMLLTLTISCQQRWHNDSSEKKIVENITETLYSCILLIEPQAQPDFDTWSKYLQTNLELDSAEVSKIPAGKHTVIIQFTIDTIGQLLDFIIVKDPGFALGEKVLKVFGNHNGKWKPAEQSGKPVKSYRKQPVIFIVEEEDECDSKLLPMDWV